MLCATDAMRSHIQLSRSHRPKDTPESHLWEQVRCGKWQIVAVRQEKPTLHRAAGAARGLPDSRAGRAMKKCADRTSSWRGEVNAGNQSHPGDSNPRPVLYESTALPTELGWRRRANGITARAPGQCAPQAVAGTLRVAAPAGVARRLSAQRGINRMAVAEGRSSAQ